MNKLLPRDKVSSDNNESPIVYIGFADEIIEFETLEDLLDTKFMKSKMIYIAPWADMPLKRKTAKFQKFFIERTISYDDKTHISLMLKGRYIYEGGYDTIVDLGYLNKDIPELLKEEGYRV